MVRKQSSMLIPGSYLVFAEDVSLGDAVQQGVGDLAGCPSHHNTDWFGLEIIMKTDPLSNQHNVLPNGAG